MSTSKPAVFMNFDMGSDDPSPELLELRLQEFFEGPLPVPGEVVELVVVERGPGKMKLQLRVKD
jgi:hypothetical protein